MMRFSRPASRRFSLQTLARRLLSGVLSSVLLFQPIMQAGAQGIVSDNSGGKGPGVVSAPNGVPVVNITSPNASGISHNQYQDFNVGGQGVVLNNSPNAGRSELGGIILGNPNFTDRRDARLILNEVTSSNRSRLEGFTEVYGRAADVIIANPNGITCDGCGFINTPRATLSTGRPVVGADGTLNGLDVNDGDVTITGRGADASRIDAFDIVSRRVTIEAPVAAGGEINVIAGRNQVDYATRTPTAKADDGSAKPAVAIDSRALGGMYAGKISLVSTEKGVGVNTASDMATHAGQLTLTADGKLVMSGRTSSATDTVVTSQSSDVVIEQQLGAQGKATVTATKGKVTVKQGATVAADGGVAVSAKDIAVQGRVQSQTTVSAKATDSIDNTGTVVAGQQTRLEAARIANAGIIQSNGLLYVKGGTLDNAASGKILAQGKLDGALSGALINRGTIESGSTLLFAADSLDNGIEAVLRSGAGLDLRTAAGMSNAGIFSGFSSASLSAGGSLSNSGTIVSGGVVGLIAAAVGNSGTILSETGLDLATTGDLVNDGTLQSGTLMSLQARTAGNQGSIQAGSGLSLRLDGALTNTKTIETAGPLVLEATSITNQAGAALRSAADVSLTAQTTLTNRGLVIGDGIALRSGGAFTNQGSILASDALTLAVGGINNSGTLSAVGSLGGTATALTNTGSIQAGEDLSLSGLTALANYGTILALNDLELFVRDSLLNEKGNILAGNDLTLLGWNNGRIGTLENASGTIESFDGDIDIKAWTLINRRAEFELGTVEDVTVYDLLWHNPRPDFFFDPDGAPPPNDVQRKGEYWVYSIVVPDPILGWDRVTVWGSSNSGTITTKLIRAAAVRDSAPGLISAGRDLYIDAGYLLNDKSSIQSGEDMVLTGTTLDNVGVTLTRQYQVAGYSSTMLRCYGGNYCSWFGNGGGSTLFIDEEYGSIDGTIVAGGSLSGSFTDRIDNRVIYAHASELPVAGKVLVGEVTQGTVLDKQLGQIPPVEMGEVASAWRNDPRFVSVINTASSSLFRPAGPSSPYLYESRADFTSFGVFYGSDYFLSAINFDPDVQLKRLGDSFFDTRLIREEVLRQTGQRWLDGSSRNDGTEMKRLLDNGIASGKDLGLTVGQAPSAEQLAALDQDIVWYVWQEAAGQKVLVPQLYLAAKTERAPAGGAVMAGADVDLRSGTLTNEGALYSRNLLALSTDGDLVNRGGSISGGTVLLSAGRDLINEARMVELGTGTNRNVLLAGMGQIGSTDDTVISAGRDVAMRGGTVAAGGDLSIAAVRDVTLETVEQRNGYERRAKGRYERSSSVTNVGSLVSAEGDVTIAAGRQLAVTGSGVIAGENATLSGKEGVSIGAATDESHYYFHSSKKSTFGSSSSTTQSDTTTVVGSVISAGNDLKVVSGGDVAIRASAVNAGNDLLLAAGAGADGRKDANLTIEAGQNSSFFEHKSKKSGFGFSGGSVGYSSSKSTTGQSGTQTVGSRISAGNNATLLASQDIAVSGSQVLAGNDALLSAGRDVTITTAQETAKSWQDSKSNGVGIGFNGPSIFAGATSSKSTQRMDGQYSVGSELSAGNNLTIDAGRDALISGSWLSAGQDLSISGRQVAIIAADNLQTTRESHKQSQFGVTFGLKGAVGDALTTVYDSATRIDQAQDSRLKGALAGQAAYNAYKGVAAWNAYNTALVNQAGAQADMALGAVDDATKAAATGPSASSGLKLSVSVGGSTAKSERSTSNSWATASTIEAGRDVTITARGGDGAAGNLAIIGSDITAGRDVTLMAKDDILIAAAQQDSSVKGSNSSSGGSIGMSFGVGSGSAGWTVDVAANGGKGRESGSGTTWRESTVTAGDTLTIMSGGDTTIRGGQASGETVRAHVGGDLTIQSLQDTDKYSSTQTSGGVQVSAGAGGGSGSASFNQDKIKSDYASVTDQSGIFAGSGGFVVTVEGHTQLDGAVIASTADEALNRLDTGTLGWSSLDNHAEYSGSSTGLSVSGGMDGKGVLSGGLPVPNIGVGAHGEASGTTQSAVAPGTILIRDKENQTQDLASLSRDTDSANAGAIDKIFDQQQVREQMEAARIFGQVANQVVGDLGLEFGWKSDGPEKAAIHGLIGALQASIGGGDILAGALSGAGSELLAAKIGEYLKDNKDLSPAQKEAIQQWASAIGGALVGSVVAGNSSGTQTGAATSTDSVKYNYLYHHEAEELSALKEKLIADCKDGECTEELKRVAYLESLDLARDQLVISLCRVPGSMECAAAYLDLKAAEDSYRSHPVNSGGAQTEQERQQASVLAEEMRQRIGNQILYHTGQGALASIGEGLKGLADLAALVGSSAYDQKSREELKLVFSSLKQAVGDVFNDPGIILDAINKKLAEADALDAQGRHGEAAEMRSKLVVDIGSSLYGAAGLAKATANGVVKVSSAAVKQIDNLLESAGTKGGKLDNLVASNDNFPIAANDNIKPKINDVSNMPKELRPPPESYLPEWYIQAHLQKFEGGVVKITSYTPNREFLGDATGTFVLPKAYADQVIAQAGGDIGKLEKLLGLDAGALGTTPRRIDIPNPQGLRMPRGTESGANSQWIAGGYTSGGTPEAIIDMVPLGQFKVKPVFE